MLRQTATTGRAMRVTASKREAAPSAPPLTPGRSVQRAGTSTIRDSSRMIRVCVWLHSPAQASDLPVLGSVVFVVYAEGILDDDGVPAAEVVVEPLRVRGAQIGAPVADVSLTLIGD